MYLSRLIISNYRSIKFLDLEFSPTKNVIIGHNNAGKSNIIKALNIILGEQTPDYKKYENISERDFFNGQEDELFIIGEISKKDTSCIDFNNLEINLAGTYITLQNDLEFYYESSQFYDFVTKVFDVNFDSLRRVYDTKDLDEGSKKYIIFNNLSMVERDKINDAINSISKFIYVFRAEKDEGNIVEKDFRLVFVKDNQWYISQRIFMRNELLISAIIPPFRDPEYQLKPTNWNWFGKMMKSFVKEKERKFQESKQESESPFDELERARCIIKESANKIFNDLKDEIERTSLISGFDGAKLIFSFMDDEIDISKNVKIYIDDGFTAPINEKGAGIQSAIVISLFTYFVRKNAVSNSLLCLEEPEIYLHPHACRVINKKINHFINDNENNVEHQVILTTHNPIFVKDENIHNPRIFRVWKNKENGTIARYVEINEDFKNLFIREENSELFFAKKVIITEGFDKYILKFYDSLENNSQLDEKNISIVSAEGKNDFINFIKICENLGIDFFIWADFDYLLRGILSNYELKEYLKEKLGTTFYRKLEKLINHYLSEEPYRSFRNKGKKIEELDDITEESKEKIKDYILQGIKELKEKANIFILTGEIEDMFKKDYKEDILENEKFTFESVIKLRKYLIEDNKNFSDIFEEEFLETLKVLFEKV